MHISNITSTKIHRLSPSKTLMFTGKPSSAKADNDDTKYVKIPRWQNTLENWIGGFFVGLTVLELLHYFATKKTEPWEDAYKELVKKVK